MENPQMSSGSDIAMYDKSMNGDPGEKLTFGEWLDDRLREKGWTQADFANFLEVAPTTVNAWVNNVNIPSRRSARMIANALHVSWNSVLVQTGRGDPDWRPVDDISPRTDEEFREHREFLSALDAEDAKLHAEDVAAPDPLTAADTDFWGAIKGNVPPTDYELVKQFALALKRKHEEELGGDSR